MSEMAITADRLVIIGNGRLIRETTVEDFLGSGSDNFVRVRSPRGDVLTTLLEEQGAVVVRQPDDTLSITGSSCDTVGELARANGLTLQELSAHQPTLEQRYMELTRDSVAYHSRWHRVDPSGEVTPAVDAVARPRISDGPLPSFTDVLRSELCKLRSVRSTYWTLVAAVVCNVGLAALGAIFVPGQLSGHEKETVDPIRLSLGGIHLSQVAFAVLGVLVISSEYSTGMIRTTLSAVPQRRRVLAAKAAVFTVTALVVGMLASFAAYFVFQAFLSDDSLRSSLGDPGVLRAVAGGGLFLTVLGLFGLGLGAIIRGSADAIAAVLGLLFVPPIVAQLMPSSWRDTIGPYLPMHAGSQIFALRHEAGMLGAWSGFAVFCAYAVVTLGAGFVLINRRDA